MLVDSAGREPYHPLLPSLAESRTRLDRNELFNYHDLSPGVSFQSIMHDRSWSSFPPSTLQPVTRFGKGVDGMCIIWFVYV